MMIGNLSTSLTKPKLPTLADIERRRHELLTLAGLHSQRKTSPASLDPASPQTAALPTPEPNPTSSVTNELSSRPKRSEVESLP